MAHSSDAVADFRAGTLRGAAGFFRAGQTHTGQWWLLDPENRPFFIRAVEQVSVCADAQTEASARLRRWSFNAAGWGSDPRLQEDGLPFVASVEFCGVGSLIKAPGIRLPDVFDSSWAKQAAAHAGASCARWEASESLIGWLTDGDVLWGQAPAEGQPGLLQVCLSLEPSFAAYHAAWEFVLALHGGLLPVLSRAWGVGLSNKEALRAMTRDDTAIFSRGYLKDDAKWTREFARRYFGGCIAAIHGHDARHLVLGCRSTSQLGSAVVAECAVSKLDVLTLSADDLRANAPLAQPVFVSGFSWVAPEFWAESGGGRQRELTPLERMLGRGRTTLTGLVQNAAVVGYAWKQWCDRAGEQPPFAAGLVHANDTDAREHTDLLTDINERVEELRSVAGVAE